MESAPQNVPVERLPERRRLKRADELFVTRGALLATAFEPGGSFKPKAANEAHCKQSDSVDAPASFTVALNDNFPNEPISNPATDSAALQAGKATCLTEFERDHFWLLFFVSVTIAGIIGFVIRSQKTCSQNGELVSTIAG